MFSEYATKDIYSDKLVTAMPGLVVQNLIVSTLGQGNESLVRSLIYK